MSAALAITPYLNPFEWTSSESDDVREWLIALGTVGAVVVALSIAARREWLAERRRPKLSLTLDPVLGLTTEMLHYVDQNQEINASSPAQYLRLSITNANGRDAATEVELFPAQIYEHHRAGFQTFSRASYPPFAWTHLTRQVVDVPAGVTRLVDVARFAVAPPEYVQGDKLELLVSPQPNDQRHLLGPGSYDLALSLSAHNTDARYYLMTVKFDPGASPSLQIPEHPRMVPEIPMPPSTGWE